MADSIDTTPLRLKIAGERAFPGGGMMSQRNSLVKLNTVTAG
jgi:hypothetical protein